MAGNLEKFFSGCTKRPLLIKEPMKRHTSFRIGGPADLMAQPRDDGELCALLKCAKKAGVPVTIIGNGSNLLVRDKGIRGLVIKLGSMLTCIKAAGDRITFGSGVPLALAAKRAAEEGLSGLEFAVGIPGSIGGAVYMNAGAYGGEMADVVESVRAIDREGNVSGFSADEMDFAYRKTAIQEKDLIITSITVALKEGDSGEIAARMEDFSSSRIIKQPLDFPSAGSTFKRPEGHFAGTLIEETGLKGYRVGGAKISEKHAGFVVNTGDATAEDVLQLIKDVQEKVFEKHGVRLYPEVLIIGEK
ncbi:MAG: UDP-N-acetylmuramate dehydrogenase [Phascolarctobacterium sp.]|nr:UDP-N-acetylmuramate dehydrogenase [Phascolarctobacterium sp.]